MDEPPVDDVDVIVIGAGAAGLAATRSLLAAGCKVATLEARGRIGGRAWTEPGPTPFDHGASFIHAEHINPWTVIARRLRVPTMIDPRGRALFVGARPANPAELAAFQAARARARDQVTAAARSEAAVSIADALQDTGPWAAQTHAALGPWMLGAENHDADAADYVAGADGRDRFVAGGYGSLVRAYGRGLAVTCEAAVRRIDYSGRGVVVDSTRGRLRGRLAVVTLPQGVLAAEQVRFEPALPLDRLRAIEALPMGLLAKVALHLDGDPFGLGDSVYAHHHGTGPPAALYQIRPGGQDLVVAFVGGNLARELEAAGEAAAAAFVLEPLLTIFGHRLRSRLRGVRRTRWGSDPFARGSYAVARPGGAPMREVLARPLADRLLFAGEACADEGWAATAAGAHRSGKRAAREALTLLRGRRGTKAFAIAPKTSPSRAGDGGARHAQ